MTDAIVNLIAIKATNRTTREMAAGFAFRRVHSHVPISSTSVTMPVWPIGMPLSGTSGAPGARTYAAASATKNQTGTAAFKIRVYDTRVKGFLLPLIAGLGLAAAFTASPLTVLALPLAWVVITLAGRGLPEDERRSLTALLWIALAARMAAIVGLFLIGLPGHSDVSVGGLSGDDAYYFGRAIRARDLLLGFASGKYDYFVVTDTYGQTNYLRLLTWLQVVAGPTPYGMRVVNALMFISGSAVLFRTVRKGFGARPVIHRSGRIAVPPVSVFLVDLPAQGVDVLSRHRPADRRHDAAAEQAARIEHHPAHRTRRSVPLVARRPPARRPRTGDHRHRARVEPAVGVRAAIARQ